MILLFPNIDTLRLCLTSNTVPSDVTLTEALVSFDDQGQIYLESTVTLSKSTGKLLDRLGVKGSKRHGSATVEKVTSWLQVLPVAKDTGTPNISTQAAVLFELDSATDLPHLVTEMLRLGNDRQSVRWIASPETPDSKHVLLRVVGPPYYTLLRALDKAPSGTASGIRAYLERAPRVWVEIGYTHPLAAQIRIADEQLVLIRQPRDWLFLADAPFQDVYEILQFDFPSAPIEWSETTTPKKLSVPLRLTAGNATDVPELWVLREDAVNQLDRLVRDADERLTQRLMFAVATDQQGQRIVVLRTRPSKLAPPVLPLETALGFKPFWKLPNLFLPAGRRLHPTLRRDAVRKLLAADPDQVVWLYPDGQGGFAPESVPESAFRSLEDWVDYIIEAEQQPLAAWIDATRFDFETFICKDTGPRNKPDKGDREPRANPEEETTAVKAVGPHNRGGSKNKGGSRPTTTAEFIPTLDEGKSNVEWKQKLDELEKQFMAVEGGLDSHERQALWPELARANAALGSQAEAAVCWLNAIWVNPTTPAEWFRAWLRSELHQSDDMITKEEFDHRLLGKSPSPADARVLIAAFLWLAHDNAIPGWLQKRLPTVQSYIEMNEGLLPVRAVWLTAMRLTQLSGADVLGLARIRDRIILRLHAQGLSVERDIPSFLRFAGHRDPSRMRAVRDNALEIHRLAINWSKSIPLNLPYIDLFFSYGLAKIGESTESRRLLEIARVAMEAADENTIADDRANIHAIIKKFLYQAFRSRIEEVLLGKKAVGQLTPVVLTHFEAIKQQARTQGTNNLVHEAEYVINRMRNESQILEPTERNDPYGQWTQIVDPLRKELLQLRDEYDPGRFADRVRRLYKQGIRTKDDSAIKPIQEVQFYLLYEAIPLSTRVGEGFAVELLRLVPSSLSTVGGASSSVLPTDLPRRPGELLQRALYIAGLYDQRDLIRQLIACFIDLLHRMKDDVKFKLISTVAGPSLKSLKKLGMHDVIDLLLKQLQDVILQKVSMSDLRSTRGNHPDNWGLPLRTMLSLAGGWLAFGLSERAAPILAEARSELLGNHQTQAASKHASFIADLTRAYISAIGQGPSEIGLPLITEVFQKLDPSRIPNTFTSNRYYSRFHLAVIEEVILTIVDEGFALGPAGRRWLDDDEFLVRRRIHADMQAERERHKL